jgi:hypothetical protein
MEIRRNGNMETRRNGYMDTWRHGHGDMKTLTQTENGSPGDFP